jgi:cysteinyl-tRNA synthetase
MALRIYNTLLRSKRDFAPIEEGKVGMYVCGITAYDMSHIGHARAYVAFDVVYRYLKTAGYEVNYVRNFTDVDDKIIKRANEQGQPFEAIPNRFIDEFYQDMDSLNVERPSLEPRVSTHMEEIIAFVSDVIARGHAYESQGDVYFSIDSFPNYGKLSGRDVNDLRAGASERVDADVEAGKKKSPLDFALWKSVKPGEPSWDSPWGKGRPGWHIECSAMSRVHLGDVFDIHGGGKDLVFPHHENEVAQSEAAVGKQHVNVWMHNGFVNVDEEKMSKSLGNFFTVREVLKKFHPEALRFFLLGTHYRSPINYSLDNIEEASTRIGYLYSTVAAVQDYLSGRNEDEGDPKYIDQPPLYDEAAKRFLEAMNDDFNTAAGIASFSDVFKHANEVLKRKKGGAKTSTLKRFLEVIAPMSEVLGVLGANPDEVLESMSLRALTRKDLELSWVEDRIQARTDARVAKDFAASDAIRAELTDAGIEVMDTPQGTKWRMF